MRRSSTSILAVLAMMLLVSSAFASSPTLLGTISGLGQTLDNSQSWQIPGTDTWLILADDGTAGSEPYAINPVTGDLTLIKDINSGTNSSYFSMACAIGDTLYFSASDGVYGRELWMTDGTTAGTKMVANIGFGSGNANIDYTTEFNGKLYFSARFNTTDQLYSSDGTEGGTALVAPGDEDYTYVPTSPRYLTVCNNMLILAGTTDSAGNELIAVNTNDEFSLVADIYTGSTGSFPGNLTVVGDYLIFSASNDSLSGVVYSLNSNTMTLTALTVDGSILNGATRVGGALDGYCYIYAETSASSIGKELYRTNGTVAGTELVKDINPSGNCDANYLTVIGDHVFFTANDGTHGNEVWATDGTEAGTQMMVDYGDESSSYGNIYYFFINVNDVCYYHYGDAQRLLYRSDGTSSGTYQVNDVSATGGFVACGQYILQRNFASSSLYSTAATPSKDLDRVKWEMIGSPVSFVGVDAHPYGLFRDDLGGSNPNGSNWRFSRWDADLEMYVRLNELEEDGADHGDPDDLMPGMGYWIIQDVDDNCCLHIEDNIVDSMIVDDDVSVTINPATSTTRGLTMLANPFPEPYEVSRGTYWVPNPPPYTIADAVSNSLISATIYTWDSGAGASGQYVPLGIDTATVDPWEGFWFEVLQESSSSGFIYYFYPSGMENPNAATVVTEVEEPQGWSLALAVRSNDGAYLDEHNRIAIREGCLDSFDPYDAAEFSPMGGRFVQAYFDHPEWDRLNDQYTFDTRDMDFSNGPKSFDFTVRTWRTPNTTYTIEWPEIRNIDPAYSFTLIDNNTDTPFEADMRADRSIHFTTGAHTGDYEYRHYTIEVEYNADILDVETEISLLPTRFAMQPAYPNPFNPTSTVTIDLPEASNLNLQLFNMLGQQVATLANGQYEAGYKRFVIDGNGLASGTYLVRAQVPGKLETTRKIQLVK